MSLPMDLAKQAVEQVQHLQRCVAYLVAERDRLEASVDKYRQIVASDHCTCSAADAGEPRHHSRTCLYPGIAYEAEPHLKGEQCNPSE